MAASKETCVYVANVLEEELGLERALQITKRLSQISGNQSYKTTVLTIRMELMRRNA